MTEIASPLAILHQRATEHWFLGSDPKQFNQQVRDRVQHLQQYKTPPTIFLAEADPLAFCAAFLAAVSANCPLFLCNPHWGEQEWQQVGEIAQPDLLWGNIPSLPALRSQDRQQTSPPPGVLIPTGGSSGKIRFALHTWETLTASIEGFYQYFGSQPVNSFCVLPLYHVSGLMQFLRSFLTGGRFFYLPYSLLKQGQRGHLNPANSFISLVPKQLQFLLEFDPHWLACFRTVLLGGAPAWTDLFDRARKHKINLAIAYGMTETASQVVTLKPKDFLSGNNSNGQPLAHARVKILDDKDNILPINRVGKIAIQAGSLCLDYYPEQGEFLLSNTSNQKHRKFLTDDLGYFDAQGYLHVVGRDSTKIITGGENVFPAEVEAALLATGLIRDVCAIGLPDSQWGQAVTAIYVPLEQNQSPTTLKRAIVSKISSYKHPKYWLEVASIPRNLQGKVNYLQLRQMAEKLILSRQDRQRKEIRKSKR